MEKDERTERTGDPQEWYARNYIDREGHRGRMHLRTRANGDIHLYFDRDTGFLDEETVFEAEQQRASLVLSWFGLRLKWK